MKIISSLKINFLKTTTEKCRIKWLQKHIFGRPVCTSYGLVTDSCGVPLVTDAHRILGGQQASSGEYPWQVIHVIFRKVTVK